jgi:hypothetical protein
MRKIWQENKKQKKTEQNHKTSPFPAKGEYKNRSDRSPGSGVDLLTAPSRQIKGRRIRDKG